MLRVSGGLQEHIRSKVLSACKKVVTTVALSLSRPLSAHELRSRASGS